VRRRALLPLLLLLTACGAPAAHPSAGPPAASSGAVASPSVAAPPPGDCRPLGDAILPNTAGSLTETDSGGFCLSAGQRLTVFLTAAGPAHWSAVSSSAPQVLAAAKTPLTAPIGVTAALFAATAPGTVELSSQDGSGKSWRVTVVVR
jgi:hypothetical protein